MKAILFVSLGLLSATAVAAPDCGSSLYSNGTTYTCKMVENGKTSKACVASGFHNTVKAVGFHIENLSDDVMIGIFINDRDYSEGRAVVTANSLKGSSHKRPDVWDARRDKAQAEFNFNSGSGKYQQVVSLRGKVTKQRSIVFSACQRIR